MPQRQIILTLAIAVAVLGIGALIVAGNGLNANSLTLAGAQRPSIAVATVIAPAPAAQTTRAVPDSQAQVQLSFAPVVKTVTPGVVNVYATTLSRQVQSPFANDPFFSRFFGDNSLFQSRPRESQSLGSGVIVDSKGVIVTNSHVVTGANDIRIALSGGREYPVDLLLDDPKSDLAVLKIRDPAGKTFPALSFADSDSIEVGDLVLAIGNPFGVGQTVTSGIVSALARTGVETGNFDYFIQTDAAINPGNSGGALVDLSGKLVGINTAIFTRSGGSVGIGFAIPANMARAVAEAALKGGPIVRPWFGARLQEVTTDIADSLKIDPPHGALIAETAKGGPAEAAGLQAGDVITAIDGVLVDAPQGFEFRFATKEIGTKTRLEYVRGGEAHEVDVAIAAAPATGAEATATIVGETRFAGTSVGLLTPPLAQDMNLPFDASGIVVTNVASGSPADRMGLEKGDLILSLNGEDIKDVPRFKALVSTPTRGWQIVIRRAGQVIQSYISG